MARINDDALMSIDFLAGFTIFLLSLIVAAGMVPGMLAGLQSATIDYDGVAYRTSVILAEDPGWFEDVNGGVGSRWEIKRDDEIQRMGLAVSKETPNIFSIAKVARFFNQTYRENPAFYRSRVFFSDIPYSFNITLKGDDFEYHLGDGTPEGEYGSIRRAVLVKNASEATLDFSNAAVLGAYADPATAPGATSTFNVSLNFTELLAPSPAYQVDPFSERITIRIENLNKTFYNGAQANLTNLKLYWRSNPGEPSFEIETDSLHLYVDGVQNSTLLTNITHNLTLIFDPGFFTRGAPDNKNVLTIRDLEFTFANSPGTNTTIKNTFNYTPTDDKVTMPPLKPAVLEVAVW